MKILAAIIVTGAGTYLMRSLFVLVLGQREFPPLAVRVLEYVAPVVMAALVVSMLTGSAGGAQVGWPQVAGLLVAGLVAAITRNHVYTLLAAMGLYWALSAVLSP